MVRWGKRDGGDDTVGRDKTGDGDLRNDDMLKGLTVDLERN